MWRGAGAGQTESHQVSAWTSSCENGRVPHSHLLLGKKGILRGKKLGTRKPVRKAVPWGPHRQSQGPGQEQRSERCVVCTKLFRRMDAAGLPPLTVGQEMRQGFDLISLVGGW